MTHPRRQRRSDWTCNDETLRHTRARTLTRSRTQQQQQQQQQLYATQQLLCCSSSSSSSSSSSKNLQDSPSWIPPAFTTFLLALNFRAETSRIIQQNSAFLLGDGMGRRQRAVREWDVSKVFVRAGGHLVWDHTVF